MPSAEIIAIGTELLLGEIQDTNSRDLALFLRANGISLYRITLVGDNQQRIAAAIKEALTRVDIVITSGGLGPTVDDPTREAVAQAVGVQTVFMPELWAQIENRFARYGRTATGNNRKQAYIPQGAIPVENRVGTAPAFIAETDGKAVISLPGVPRELEYLLEHQIRPYLRRKFPHPEIIKARVLHAAGVGESQIDEWIGDLETSANPTVGLAAHSGQVDIRITARAFSEEDADRMLAVAAQAVYQRMGSYIYGENGDTQEKIIRGLLDVSPRKVLVRQSGMSSEFADRLEAINIAVTGQNPAVSGQYDALFEFVLQPGEEKQLLSLKIATKENEDAETRSWGGPPKLADTWAINSALDFMRRRLSHHD